MSITPDTTLGIIEFLFGELLGGIIAVIIGVTLIFYLVLLVIQRVNDIGWSRWSALLAVVPVASIFLGVVLFLRKGAVGQEATLGIIKEHDERLKKSWFQISIILILLSLVGIVYYSNVMIPAHEKKEAIRKEEELFWKRTNCTKMALHEAEQRVVGACVSQRQKMERFLVECKSDPSMVDAACDAVMQDKLKELGYKDGSLSCEVLPEDIVGSLDGLLKAAVDACEQINK